MVLGIEPEKVNQLNQLSKRVSRGHFFESGESVVMGEGLAQRLELAVGGTLVLLGQERFGMTAAGKYGRGHRRYGTKSGTKIPGGRRVNLT